MRRPGSRGAQVGCLPPATASRNRPLPPGGARSRDPRRRKGVRGDATQRVGRERGEASGSPEGLAIGRRGRHRRRGGRDARLPSSLPAEGPTRASRPPHIRVSGDTQLLLPLPLPPPPPLPRHRNAKLPATTATPSPSDGSYLGPSWARLRNALLLPEPAPLTCPEPEDGRHARCVSRRFSARPGRRGFGERRARVRPQRRRGGRPRVRASTGGRLVPYRRPLPLFPPCRLGIKPPTRPAVEVCLEDPSPTVLLLVAGTALCDFQFRYLSSSTRASVQKRGGD